MKKSLRIFVSSTVKDLAPEREMAARAIETLKLEALRAETFGARPDTPADTCKEMVRECDVFVGIYGGRYGFVPPGQSVSVTEMEFREAREAGKDILIYIKGDTEPKDQQADFLRRVGDFDGGYFRRPPFRSLTELEEWLKEDLIALLSSRFVTRTPPRTKTVEGDYRKYVSTLYDTISFAGLAQTPSGLSVPLHNLFISPRLRPLSPQDLPKSVTLSINEVFSSSQRTLIVGSPGSGKTSLLGNLALQAARGTLQVKGWERSLPILVPLVSWVASIDRAATDSLDEHILRFVGSRSEPRFESVIEEALQSDQALVLLDGLDEIESGDLRQRVASGVGDFCYRYPNAKVVMTTRPIVTVSIPRFATYEVLPWNDEQIKEFVYRWSAAFNEDLGGAAEPKAQSEELLFSIGANGGLRELAKSPLLLTILAFLHRQGYRLPTRRVEVYDAVVKTMLGSWNRARSLSHMLPRRFDSSQVEVFLSKLALEMAVRDLNTLSLEDVADLRRTSISNHHWPELDIPQFADDLIRHSAILVERKSGRFSFVHRNLQEFFAAKALTALTDEDALRFITAHYFDRRYEEIIRLALGWMDVHGGRQSLVARAAEELLSASET